MTNSKHTKRALLSSALALLLCFTMLLGTTFAWFTDTASTSVNTIQAGTLDVVLEMYENGNWVSAEGKTLEFKKAAAASGDEKVLWDPGCTYTLPELRVRNNGNLALKYKVVITGINGDAKLNEVIEWTIGEDDLNEALGTEHYLFAGETSETFAISGHMMETAGNEYQGLQITGIAITVYATQYTHEYDSNDNQYDKDATYVEGSNVITGDAVLNGTYIALDDNGNVAGDKNAVRVTGGNVVIEGGYYDGASGGDNSAVRVDTGATVTIKNGYFTVGTDANGNGNNLIYAAGGTIIIEGGTFYNPHSYNGRYYTLNCNDKDGYGGSITVKGGKYYKFNPAEATTEGTTSYVGNTKKNITVADGYKVVQNGDWYYVVPEGAIAASNANELLNAAATATAGDVVYLTDDITVTETTIFNASGITVEGFGHTITYNGTADNNGVTVLQFGSGTNYCENGVTVRNLTITGSGKGALRFNGGSSSLIENVTVSGTWYLAVNFYGTHGATMNNCNISSDATIKWCKSTVFANEQSAYQLILNNTTIDSIFVNATDKGSNYANNGVKLVVNDGSTVGTMYTNEGIARKFYEINGTGAIKNTINTVDFTLDENVKGY